MVKAAVGRWQTCKKYYDSHPNGTHDDVFWSIALAIYATVEMQPEPFLTVVPQ